MHQDSDLSPYLFSVIIYKVTKEILRCETPWYMMFADDKVLIEGNRKETIFSMN